MTDARRNPDQIGADLHLEAATALTVPIRALIYLTIAICVVIPHSLQVPTAALLLMSAASSLLVLRVERGITYVGVCFVASALVTVIYILVGMVRGATGTAVLQTIAIYIVAPLLWMTVWRSAIQLSSAERLVRFLIPLAALACLTVALFFFLFFTVGPQAVSFFSSESNISVSEGVSGATMHVYGSLIFLTGAVFAAPELIRRGWARIALLAALAAAALTSGRSALILAMPVGLLIGIVIRRMQAGPERRNAGTSRYLIIFLVVLSLLALLALLFTDLNIGAIAQSTYDKILSGGGEARTDQSAALKDGISDTLGLGAGHGIGVSVVRSYDYPWRYENVPLASIYRVGVLGAAVYVAAWAITLLIAVQRLLARRWQTEDTFVLAGLAAMILAAPTNPYLESFIFQWAYTFPLIYFSHRAMRDGVGGR